MSRKKAQPFAAIGRQARDWADRVMDVVGPAADFAIGMAGMRATDPAERAAIRRAGAVLKSMRAAAGLTLQEVTRAIDLTDPALLEQAERGKIALPFEIVLRLAAVLGRSDPMTATMRIARAYNPALWEALDELGVGRLVVQAGRERELANVYRGNDMARRLSDAEFARVLAFTKSAFDMAVEFRSVSASAGKRRRSRGAAASAASRGRRASRPG